jgi:hypothetical protein
VTLILSCLTPKYIVQVSDRRLTDPRTGSTVDDAANKAIIFHSAAAIGYTGISEIHGQRTDEWIVDQLYGLPGIESAINTLKDRLDRVVRSLPHPYRPLAVVIDCWATRKANEPVSPWHCLISNFHDRTTGLATTRTFNIFNVFRTQLPEGKGYAFRPMGQNMERAEMRVLFRNVVRAMRHSGPTPTTIQANTVSRFMVTAVRAVANRNSLVGDNLMLTIVPNRSIAEFKNTPDTAAYIRGSSNDMTHYVASVVSPTMSIKGMKLYPGPPRFPTN